MKPQKISLEKDISFALSTLETIKGEALLLDKVVDRVTVVSKENTDKINLLVSNLATSLEKIIEVNTKNVTETNVVIEKLPVILLELQKKRRTGEKIPVYVIDQEKCKQCKTCIGKFGCPAFYFAEDDSVHIDETQCNGCGNCVQICPFDAIHKKEEGK